MFQQFRPIWAILQQQDDLLYSKVKIKARFYHQIFPKIPNFYIRSFNSHIIYISHSHFFEKSLKHRPYSTTHIIHHDKKTKGEKSEILRKINFSLNIFPYHLKVFLGNSLDIICGLFLKHFFCCKMIHWKF